VRSEKIGAWQQQTGHSKETLGFLCRLCCGDGTAAFCMVTSRLIREDSSSCAHNATEQQAGESVHRRWGSTWQRTSAVFSVQVAEILASVWMQRKSCPWGQKKKKQVDPAILEKRAKAAAIREEAIKKAAEARRLKEQGESAEVAPKEPSISAKPAAAPPQTIATPEPARPAPIKKPIQTATARKRAPSVAEKRAIKALEDQKKPEGRAMAERPKPKSPKVANVIKEAKNSVGNVPTEDEVMKMKVVELKDVLRGNKLRLSGRKAELLERVLNFIRAA